MTTVTSPKVQRRGTGPDRKTIAAHVETAVVDAIDRRVAAGAFPNRSVAVEEGLRLVLIAANDRAIAA